MAVLAITSTTTTVGGKAATILKIDGPADLGNEAVLEREITRLMAARPALVVLDVSGMTFLASLAVGQFVALARSLRGTGALRVAAPRPDVRLVLERCKVTEVLGLRDSVEEALGG